MPFGVASFGRLTNFIGDIPYPDYLNGRVGYKSAVEVPTYGEHNPDDYFFLSEELDKPLEIIDIAAVVYDLDTGTLVGLTDRMMLHEKQNRTLVAAIAPQRMNIDKMVEEIYN